MAKKKSNRSWKGYLMIAIFLIAGIALGYFIGSLSSPDDAADAAAPSLPNVFLVPLFAGILVSIVLGIALHECGHVLMGLAQNFSFRSITVMIFSLKKEAGRFKFEWNFDVNTAGGLALCLPEGTQNLRVRFAWYALGGPLASLICAAICLFLGFYVFADVTKATPWAYVMASNLNVLGFVNLTLFVVTMLPAQAGGFYTDGARFFKLMKGGAAAQIDLTLLHVMTLTTGGVRPAAYPRAQLEAALSLPVESIFRAYLHAFLYMHHLDRREIMEAKQHLTAYEAAADQIPKGFRDAVYLELAYFTALFEGEVAMAKGYMALDTKSKAVTDDLRHRAKAAIAFVERDYPTASEEAKKAIKAAPKNMDKGLAQAEIEWMQHLLTKIDQPTVEP